MLLADDPALLVLHEVGLLEPTDGLLAAAVHDLAAGAGDTGALTPPTIEVASLGSS